MESAASRVKPAGGCSRPQWLERAPQQALCTPSKEDKCVVKNMATGGTDSGMEHFGYKESLARSIGAWGGGPGARHN
jgi:hypothetical protein